SSSSLNTTGLSSSYRRLLIAPRGTYYLPNQRELDLRLEKNFTAGSNRLGVYADISNLFNSAAITNVITRPTSVTLPSGTSFPLPFATAAGLQAPRQIRIGARWSF